MIMTGSLSIRDIIGQYLRKFSLNRSGAYEVIRFSLTDIFYRQRQIVALWRELNERGLKPVAKTFLGRIIRISLHS